MPPVQQGVKQAFIRAGEAEQIAAMRRKRVQFDERLIPRIALGASQVGKREELAEIGIALAILRNKDEIPFCGRRRRPHRQFSTEYLLDTVFFTGLLETDHTINPMPIGDGHGRHAEAGSFGDKGFWR